MISDFILTICSSRANQFLTLSWCLSLFLLFICSFCVQNFLFFAFLLWATVVVSRPRQTWLPYRMHNYLFFCLAKHLIIFCVLFVYIRHPRIALDSSEKKKVLPALRSFFSLCDKQQTNNFFRIYLFFISRTFLGLRAVKSKRACNYHTGLGRIFWMCSKREMKFNELLIILLAATCWDCRSFFLLLLLLLILLCNMVMKWDRLRYICIEKLKWNQQRDCFQAPNQLSSRLSCIKLRLKRVWLSFSKRQLRLFFISFSPQSWDWREVEQNNERWKAST